jgi:methionyl-tRNA formyltransferase
MNVIFLGTPEFAVPTLEALVRAGHAVQAVYTQPDRPKGRGQALAFPPVKEAALRLGLPVRQPERVRRPEAIEELAAYGADLYVVVGYGQILPQAIIDLPRFGIVNVHASLLPRWRGAAPIQWAVAAGDRVTGVTTMMIDAGLDTGDILLQAETAIGADETAVELGARLAASGAELLIETARLLEAGACPRARQNAAQATLARILKKEDGLIDWSAPAETIAARARGFLPWPGAYTAFRGQRFGIWSCRAADPRPLAQSAASLPANCGTAEAAPALAPGRVFVLAKRLYVATGSVPLELLEVQMEGRKRVPAAAFLNGTQLSAGERLG